MTLLLNPVPWLLAACCAYCLARRDVPVRERLRTYGEWLGLPAVVAGLALLVVLHAGGRLAAAWVSPGDFVQEVVAAESFTANGTLYPRDLSARANVWSHEHRAAVAHSLPASVLEAVRARTPIDPRWYGVQAHPPTLLLAFVWPITHLGVEATLAAMCVLSLVAAGWATSAVVRALVPGISARTALALALVACTWQPVLASIRDGQVSVVIAALACAGWLWAERGRPVRAGVALGLAMALKLYPAALLVYFAWRSRRTAAVALATAGLCLVAAALVAGADAFASYAESARTVVRMFGAAPGNYSLMRLVRGVAGFDETGAVAAMVAAAIPAAVVFAMIGRAHVRGGGPTVLDRAEEFSLAACTALLVSPVSWHHYAFLALLPLVVLLARAADTGRVGVVIGWAVLVGAWSLPAYVLTSAWWSLPEEPSLLRVVASPTLVLPCAWVALAGSIAARSRPGRPAFEPISSVVKLS